MYESLAASGLTPLHATFLVAALLVACGFEFVNGFHDTANAVATVIYTSSLKPVPAVVLSGLLNFTGVLTGGLAVAIGILKLLPTDLLVSGGAGAGLAMVLALLVAAVVWNVGTWYFGIPASSSHTLIGAILGVGIANSLLSGHGLSHGVNWGKAGETGLALLVSPVFGFLVTALLFMLLRALLKARVPAMFEKAEANTPPPWPVRLVLVATCSAVSYAHGKNDGQKGVGLMMLILIGLAPAGFALNASAGAADVGATLHAAADVRAILEEAHALPHDADVAALEREIAPTAAKADDPGAGAVVALHRIETLLEGKSGTRAIAPADRFRVRQAILLLDDAVKHLGEAHKLDGLSKTRKKQLEDDVKAVRGITDYAPLGVMIAVALSLGVGTMVGWRRIVVTVGEKIGKTHLSWSQGMSAEMIAASTIWLASSFGLPVSTTHCLSSGIAGSMVASGSGIQSSTVRNILLAWVLTLPASMLLAGLLFALFRAFV